MRCVVTGAAGFIGSQLCEQLLADGHAVRGIDCFTPYYPRPSKQQNLAGLIDRPHFQLTELDLADGVPEGVLDGTEWLFHLAAMPGLTRSWTHFDEYNRCNLTATHRLLEVAKQVPTLSRFVLASTSSVYGKYASGDESLPTRPSSPYGITKLAAEQLARVYLEEFNIPVTILRYFSVYGPRQRPDMGYHKFIDCVLRGQPIPLTGDGSQVRGNTYVADCVAATIAATRATPGETFNLGGGELVSVAEAIRKIERIAGIPAKIEHLPPRRGDQIATGADIGKLTRHTGWTPQTSIDDGLARQVAWHREMLKL
jgi:nucleoside-diphosphate-sugar epimerase